MRNDTFKEVCTLVLKINSLSLVVGICAGYSWAEIAAANPGLMGFIAGLAFALILAFTVLFTIYVQFRNPGR